MPKTEQATQYDPTTDPRNTGRDLSGGETTGASANPMADQSDYYRRYTEWMQAMNSPSQAGRDQGAFRWFQLYRPNGPGAPGVGGGNQGSGGGILDPIHDWLRQHGGQYGGGYGSTFPFDSDQDSKFRDMVVTALSGFGLDRFTNGVYSPQNILGLMDRATPNPLLDQSSLALQENFQINPADTAGGPAAQMFAPSVSEAMQYGQGAADIAARSAAIQSGNTTRQLLDSGRVNPYALTSAAGQIAQQAAGGVGAAGVAGYQQGLGLLQQTGQANLGAQMESQRADQSARLQALLSNQQASLGTSAANADIQNRAQYFNAASQSERRAQELGLLQKSLDQSLGVGQMGFETLLNGIMSRPKGFLQGNDTYGAAGPAWWRGGMWQLPFGARGEVPTFYDPRGIPRVPQNPRLAMF